MRCKCYGIWMRHAVVILILVISLSGVVDAKESKTMKSFSNLTEKVIQLPAPVLHGGMSIAETLSKRESTRNFTSKLLTPSEISQVLWAAQGITRNWGGRAAPSAGALYPLELYLVIREGLFHYMPRTHQLIRVSDQNLIDDLSSAALDQECVRGSPAIVVITAVYERMERKYGRRSERYVKIEAGHVAQNIHLQAVSLALGSVPVGSFNDDQVQKVLNLPANHEPLYLIPLGHIKK